MAETKANLKIGSNMGCDVTFSNEEALHFFAREVSCGLSGMLAFASKHYQGDYDINAMLSAARDQAWQLEQAIDLICPAARATE